VKDAANLKNLIQPLKGTRDFYPEEMRKRQWLYGVIRTVSESFGYQEWEAPFLERLELYAAKSGEELVKEQAFVFQDRGGDYVALRPELTPSLARMVAQKQAELAMPLRWWSFGPFWRYERPQRGRTREFFQWNIDLIGVNTPEADAEMLSLCAAFFQQVGLSTSQVEIRVNSRELMAEQLVMAGITEQLRTPVFRLIDRRDKMTPEAWDVYAGEIGLTADQLTTLKRMLEERDLWQQSPELVRIFKILEEMGLRGYFRFDPLVIRGLDYYTGVVFEAYDREGGRAILGGGRYNNLVSDVGGEPIGGMGFAMGDMMITIVLEKHGLLAMNPPLADTVLVTVFDDERVFTSVALAAELRRAGIKVVLYPETVKLPKQLKFADRMGIQLAVIIGPDEYVNGQVVIKDLAQRTQEIVAREEVVARVKSLLA
jgi:histidyl-tRNA synthetase